MFHKVILTDEEVRRGKLFQISDALNDVFVKTSQEAMGKMLRNNLAEMVIHFENSGVNDNFYDENDEDTLEVLYFNDEALRATQAAGIRLNIVGTVDGPPKHCGLMARLYRF